MRSFRLTILVLIALSSMVWMECWGDQANELQGLERVIPVTKVHNPAKPRFKDRAIVLDEELSIGKGKGGREYTFSKIEDLAVDEHGNIYAIDSDEAAVRIFNKEGRYVRTIGHRGQGFGEMQEPVFIQVTAQGELAVYDHHQSYIESFLLFYSLEGKFLRQKKILPFAMYPIGMDSKGYLLGQYFFAPPDGRKAIVRFDTDGGVTEFGREMEFRKDKVLDIGRPSCYGALSPDDRILYGDSKEYRLFLWSADEETCKMITKTLRRPPEITEMERQEYRNKYAEILKKGVKFSFRTRWPAFSGLFVDDEGRIFVKTYERTRGGLDSFYYDVFNKEGVYEAKVTIPVTLDNNSVWKNGRVYTVETKKNGLPLIKRHRVTWKEGGQR